MKYILTVFTIFLSYCNTAQSVCKLSQQELDLYLCVNDYTSIESSASLTLGLSEIVSEIGLSQSNFTMKTCNSIENAVAVILDGERELLIDENYLYKLNNSTNNNFYIFILAHEIGHHLNGHTLKSSNNSTSRKQELEADYFAGFVLKKLNGTIEDITKTLMSLPHPKENVGTHPILNDRLYSAKNGFNDAQIKESEILQKYENEITKKVQNANKINALNLARSLAYKFFETGNIEFYNSSRRYYEELINKKYFENIPYIELSFLYKLNDDLISSIQILNEIKKPNFYTALLLYENYNMLKKPTPKKVQSILNIIDPNSIQDFTYQVTLANYYYDTNKLELTKKIYDNLLKMIEEGENVQIDRLELFHFYSNYSYFLNTQSQFELSVQYSQKALDLMKTFENIENKQMKSNYKSTYYTFSMALLGTNNYILLEKTLKAWEQLGLTPDERNNEFLYISARLAEETGNLLSAINGFKLYLNLNNDPFANFHLGKCYLQIKNTQSACIEFQTACENNVIMACRYLKLKCDE